jgi:hypothetical protein
VPLATHSKVERSWARVLPQGRGLEEFNAPAIRMDSRGIGYIGGAP